MLAAIGTPATLQMTAKGRFWRMSHRVEEDRYYIEALTQIRAVCAALDKVEQEILQDRQQHCVTNAFHAGTRRDRQIKIEELMELLERRRSWERRKSLE